jgi:hypothetical protein
MYEQYLTAFRNGVTDINLSVDEDDDWHTDTDGELNPNDSAVSVTVTFAATTDSEAWITITGDGFVHPAFGGTGTSREELDRYAEQAVTIWRALTDETETTCRYKLPDGDDRDQSASEHVVNA